MRVMPRMFWRLRKLEHATRDVAGCDWHYRWISRRSLLLMTRWESTDAMDAWIKDRPFRVFHARAMRIPGTRHRRERYTVDLAELVSSPSR
jgi:heme-degrading monooxygenase HmoA